MKKSTTCALACTLGGIRNTLHAIRHTIPPRCDNCFFSLWMMNPGRPVLICMQKVNFVGRWRGVIIDNSCGNFYPSSIFSAGPKAARRIPLTQGKFAIVDSEDYYRLVKLNWYAESHGKTFYAARRNGKSNVMMHRLLMDPPDNLVVDHIDHNGLNNRKNNLRVCTNAQNIRNAGRRGKGFSKYKGVRKPKNRKKWTAVIHLNEKTYYLGAFENEIDAAKAYDKRAKELHGEFACLNFSSAAEAASI